MTEAADGETGRPPAPRRAPWEMRDLIVLGVAAAVAAVVALIAQYGGVPKAQPMVGLIVILGIAYAFSTNRRAISLNTVAWGLGLQILFALIVLKTTVGRAIFQAFGAGITKILDFAFVGGSFVTRGGQNVLEPAAQGKPVLFGPHMENFKDSVQVLQGRGGIQVATPEQLLKVADELLSRPDQLEELGGLARGSVSAIRGASARNVEHMLAMLPRGKAAAA